MPYIYIQKGVIIMKRFLALVLVALSFVCICSFALAEENNSTRASNYFANYGISVTPIGNGKLSFTMSCSAVGTASQLGVSSYSVQKYTDSGWVTVATGGSDYKYNVSSYALSKTFNGVVGEKYRVKCTFLCTKSDGTGETKSSTSPSVTAN